MASASTVKLVLYPYYGGQAPLALLLTGPGQVLSGPRQVVMVSNPPSYALLTMRSWEVPRNTDNFRQKYSIPKSAVA